VREPKDIRLFFALWPDSGLRTNLQHAADSIVLARTARRVPAANLHLTLHFVGNVYLDDMACMRSQARLVDAAAFQLNIDTQGCFTRPRVAWLGCSDTPEALADLHRQLGARLQSCAYQPETRPYHPHITVARKVESIEDASDFASLSWRVESFALIEVQPVAKGVQYRVVESWPLH
jgi:2'-5' RNA ligase